MVNGWMEGQVMNRCEGIDTYAHIHKDKWYVHNTQRQREFRFISNSRALSTQPHRHDAQLPLLMCCADEPQS